MKPRPCKCFFLFGNKFRQRVRALLLLTRVIWRPQTEASLFKCHYEYRVLFDGRCDCEDRFRTPNINRAMYVSARIVDVRLFVVFQSLF